jgi:hypothetical protein
MPKMSTFFNLENGLFFIYIYSGMDDCKSSHYIWKDSTIGATSGAGTAYPSWTPEFKPGF